MVRSCIRIVVIKIILKKSENWGLFWILRQTTNGEAKFGSVRAFDAFFFEILHRKIFRPLFEQKTECFHLETTFFQVQVTLSSNIWNLKYSN